MARNLEYYYRRERCNHSAHIAFAIAKSKVAYDRLLLDWREKPGRNYSQQALLELNTDIGNVTVVVEIHNDDLGFEDDYNPTVAELLPYNRKQFARHEAWLRARKTIVDLADYRAKDHYAYGIITYVQGCKDFTESSCWGYDVTEYQDMEDVYCAEILDRIKETMCRYRDEVENQRQYACSC